MKMIIQLSKIFLSLRHYFNRKTKEKKTYQRNKFVKENNVDSCFVSKDSKILIFFVGGLRMKTNSDMRGTRS